MPRPSSTSSSTAAASKPTAKCACRTARLEPADLTNAVLASGDEVLVGAPPVDPAQRWIVVSNIRLTLGDDVNINALGLTAQAGRQHHAAHR